LPAPIETAKLTVSSRNGDGIYRGTAMLAVVLDVYEGGKDLIPGWKLKEHAESALPTGGVEGLRRYYEACLTGSGQRVKTTLEREQTKDFGVGARTLHDDLPGCCPVSRILRNRHEF